LFVITRETIISDIMENAPNLVPMFEEIGMHCMGCALASGENVEQACAAHGVNPDEFISRLNASISGLVQ
jgi:hybrid cluster-associated redox disulfide protein